MAAKNVFFLCVFLSVAGSAHAGGFFDADEDALRSDVQHLGNSGLIDMPVTTWPLPVDDLRAAVAKLRSDDNLDLTDSEALNRVLARLDRIDTSDDDSAMVAGSLHPTRFRENQDLPRDDGNLGINGGRSSGRFTAHLEGTVVSSPSDKQAFRVDGSYGSVRLGNWLFSAGEIPRNDGPSENDSLTLSTNARPVPAFGVDRNLSTAPSWRWLSWIGPWRVSAFVGTLEHAREDVRSPYFGGVRITFKPTRGLEIGLTRNAQFCGDGRVCNLRTIRDLLFGYTNTNTSAGITAATDPGNDQAGFDARWVSPIGNLPYAVYGQMIGEDQQGGVPFKYLGQFGFETWSELRHGGLFHLNLEYENTTCSFSSKKIYGCAYHHYIYDKEGWRYKGDILGSSWESDAEVVTLNLRWNLQHHDELQLHVRHGTLNKGNLFDPFNIEAPTKRGLNGADFDYRWTHGVSDFRIGAGFDRLTDPQTSTSDTTPHVFAIWRRRI